MTTGANVRRIVSIGIVSVWVFMTVLLVRRTWPAPPIRASAPPVGGSIAADEWLGVYHERQKVGYTHHQLTATATGFAFTEESLLRLTVMDQAQTVRTQLHGNIGHDYALHDVDFELSSGIGQLRVSGVVDGAVMRLKLDTGKDSSEQILPVTEPIYLPSTLGTLLSGSELQPGRQLERLVFDPMTLQHEHIQVTVEGEEAVPDASPAARGWRLREQFHGVQTTAWVNADGDVLREEGPMGLVLIRQSAEDSLNQGWASDTALDLMTTVAIPVRPPIQDPRNRQRLQVMLSGIDVTTVPSDDEQVRHGAEVTIVRPNAKDVGTYDLPYAGADHAAELVATPFLQSDHPRVRAAAHQAVGDERDAKRATRRLNEWVYAQLRKVPTISIPNALQVLDMGEGDCNEHAVLFAALARAAGLPSRVVAGAVYLEGAFLYHAWCEVWLGRWVSVDPTFEQFPADATHIKLVNGGPEEHMVLLKVIGRLGIHVIETPAGGTPG